MAKKTEFELLLKIVGAMDPSVTNAANMTKRQLQKMKDDIDKADSVLWGGLTKAAKIGMAAVTAAGTATIAVGKQAYNVGTEFEKAMSQWAATADANVSQYTKAEAAALKWGRQTTKTATESAEALTYMATAGWDVDRSIDALPRILKLSEAANLDLAHTSDLVTNAMAATGTEAEDLGRLLDVAAKANNKSNQTAEQLLLAWRKTGANLDNLNVDLEESGAALGILANRGKKAEEAGTALNSVILNMTTGAGQAGKEMAKLGLSAFDNEGKFKGLKQMFVELNEATKDMSDKDREIAFGMIGGKRQVEALTDIMAGLNHEVSKGVTEWDYLENELNHADGALEKMAARRMDNLWGDMKILESAMQDAGIRAYKGFAEPMRDATQMATEAVYDFSENVSDRIGEWYPTIRREMKDAAGGIKEVVAPLMSAGDWVMSHSAGVTSGLAGIAAGITTFHAAWSALKGLSGAATLFKTLGTTALPITAIALAGGALAGLEAHARLLQRQLAKESISKHFGDITLNVDELRKVARQLVGEKTLDRLNAALTEMGNLKELGKIVDDAGGSIEKFSLKVHSGIELNEEDIENMGVSISSMVENSAKAVEQQRITMRLNVQALFGEGSEKGDSIISSMEQANSILRGRIEVLGKQLGETYSEALEDGIISLNEMTIIADLEEKIRKITGEVTQYQSKALVDYTIGKLSMGDLSGESFRNALDVLDEVSTSAKESTAETTQNTMAGINVTYDTLTSMPVSNKERERLEKERKEQLDAAMKAGLAQEQSAGFDPYNKMMAVIEQKYGETLDAALASSEAAMSSYIQEQIERNANAPKESRRGLNEIYIGATAQGDLAASDAVSAEDYAGLETLYNDMLPKIREYQEVRDSAMDSGQTIDKEIAKWAEFGDKLDELFSEDGKLRQLGRMTLESQDLSSMKGAAEEAGQIFPTAVTEGMANAQREKEAEQRAVGKLAGDSAAAGLKDADVQADADAYAARLAQALQAAITATPIHIVPNVQIASSTGLIAARMGAAGAKKNALGGIYYSPILTEVAEGGDAEAIIPINSSPRAASLFEKTGDLLRSAGASVGGGAAYSYAPNITFQINGNADENTIRNAMRMSYEEWLNCAQRYERDRARLAY